MKTISRLCAIVAAIVGLSACQQKESEMQQATSPQEVMEQIGFAWNLGNHFDSFFIAEGLTPDNANYWDGAHSTEALYKSLAENGVKAVRIPVTWGAWQTAESDYEIDPAFIEIVKQNVHWAKDAGLSVIINLHHDEFWLDIYNAARCDSTNQAIMHRIERTWSQVAEAFKEEGHYLFFEAFNEVHAKTAEMEDWSCAWAKEEGNPALDIMNDWNALAVRTIRATGAVNATRWIVLNGYCGSAELAMTRLVFPEDEAGRLMVSVHTYWPVDFTLEDKRETWGVGEEKEEDEAAVINLFKALKETFTDKGIPCYLGEFGCDAHATEEGEICRLNYLTMIAQEAKKANMPVIIWDNGFPGAGPEHHAYFDHNDGQVVPGAEKIIEALANVYSNL